MLTLVLFTNYIYSTRTLFILFYFYKKSECEKPDAIIFSNNWGMPKKNPLIAERINYFI